MPPKRFDMTYKKKVGISYHHYGILVFAQGAWSEKDKESLLAKVREEKRQGKLPNLYKVNFPTSCDRCTQIHNIFEEIRRQNDAIEYISHDLWLEIPEIKKFTEIMFDDDKLKKLYIVQGGPVKRTEVGKKIDLRARFSPKKNTKTEFLKILNDEKFEEEVLYEVIRDKYY